MVVGEFSFLMHISLSWTWSRLVYHTLFFTPVGKKFVGDEDRDGKNGVVVRLVCISDLLVQYITSTPPHRSSPDIQGSTLLYIYICMFLYTMATSNYFKKVNFFIFYACVVLYGCEITFPPSYPILMRLSPP